MQEIQYKSFSLRTHQKNWFLNNTNVCQFELTFGCGLHCRHCYTDCYNQEKYLKRELTTPQIKLILDKVFKAGVIWVCFTGGDPLTRKDFLEIYNYAKDKGFLITIFTNGYSMNKKIINLLKKKPPFVIELTLNAVNERLYEDISLVKGSFKKVQNNILLMLQANLPLKIKTLITRENVSEVPRIKKYLRTLGLKFYPSIRINARLNGDRTPCNLRISPEDLQKSDGRKSQCEDCKSNQNLAIQRKNKSLFRCAISGGDGIYIDPYGNTFACSLIREPKYNLLNTDINFAKNRLISLIRNKLEDLDSKCNHCRFREKCFWCPGQALVETGRLTTPINYYCQLAKRYG